MHCSCCSLVTVDNTYDAAEANVVGSKMKGCNNKITVCRLIMPWPLLHFLFFFCELAARCIWSWLTVSVARGFAPVWGRFSLSFPWYTAFGNKMAAGWLNLVLQKCCTEKEIAFVQLSWCSCDWVVLGIETPPPPPPPPPSSDWLRLVTMATAGRVTCLEGQRGELVTL